jgi:hypothetical protein
MSQLATIDTGATVTDIDRIDTYEKMTGRKLKKTKS